MVSNTLVAVTRWRLLGPGTDRLLSSAVPRSYRRLGDKMGVDGAYVRELIDKRAAARHRGDMVMADEIRKQLPHGSNAST